MMQGPKKAVNDRNLYLSSLFGGGTAGLFVDVVLFPLDTLKTRLQAADGFKKSGGFKGVYRGLGPQAIGGVPQAAFFFLTYESIKSYAEKKRVSSEKMPFVYMFGASVAEVVACLVRVPMEVVKQRRQTVADNRMTSLRILRHAYETEGLRKGLYRGFLSTIIREVPFSVIQFPILEYLKEMYRVRIKRDKEINSWEVAVCGSIAGGTAAAVTTPLDVAKTRIMLADHKLVREGDLTVRNTLKNIYRKEGLRGLFAGFYPRVLWITLGGCIFFGSYDFSKNFFNDIVLKSESKLNH